MKSPDGSEPVKRHKTQPGFTLYELLVAVVVATILIVMVYTVYTKASRSYRNQSMAVAMQQHARFAIDHLRRDIALAGFNATPNSTLDPNVCMQPASPLRAITAKRSLAGTTVASPTQNPNIAPLEFTLFGDYTGANGEIFITQSVAGNTVTLQTGFETLITEAQFLRIFADNKRRYLRIVDAEQYEVYIPISGANYGARQIVLESAPPVRSGTQTCGIQGFGLGLQVSPAMFIRYRLELTDAARGATALVREDVQVDGVTPVEDSKLLIADNVVDFSAYDFVLDNDATKRSPSLAVTAIPDASILDESGEGGVLGSLSATSQNLRFMTIKVTVRTDQEDPELTHVPRAGPYTRMNTYDVYPGLEGAARTLSLTSKVMLQTLAVRNI